MTAWRYIAQRALTGEWLSWDLPLERDELSWTLSGAGSLRGRLAPDTGSLRASDGRQLLEEWGTLIYAEADGIIRWGGILVSSEFVDQEWHLEATGFVSYPHGIPYTGEYSKIGVDPAEVVAHLWEHVQSHPDGDLGVEVLAPETPVRLGTPAEGTEGEEGYKEAEPYELLWWEAPDVGAEIDSLATETPFDYVEEHFWDGDEIRHRIRIGYPRIGSRRRDLTFVEGDNIVEAVTVTRYGDDFANEIIGLGLGEGENMLRGVAAVRDGRLRRTHVYSGKAIGRSRTMDRFVQRELAWRSKTLGIESVVVRDHPNARIGSWSVGDDVLVQARVPWLGDVSLWCRIVGWSLLADDVASLSLARTDSFTYGG